MTDVAAHKALEGAPGRSEHLLQIVIDSIPQRVFWKDRNSVYLGCNRSFARDAGLDDPSLIVGKNDFQLAWKATAHLYVADDRLVMESNTSGSRGTAAEKCSERTPAFSRAAGGTGRYALRRGGHDLSRA